MKETPEQFMEACRFANKSAPLHIGDNMPDPNTCGNEYAALTGSPYAPRFKEQAYVAEINQLLARVAELEIQNLGLSEQAIKDRREAGELRARVAELQSMLAQSCDNLCTWEADEDGIWHAACDHTSQNLYCFTEGGPEGNGFKFCPFCGRPLVEVKSIPASE